VTLRAWSSLENGAPARASAGRWQWWLLALGWWTLNGFASATNYRFLRSAAGDPVTWEHALRTTMTSALLWVPFTVMAAALAERFPVETGLVHDDPAAADRMIARLSTLLRHSLDNTGASEVPLREELGFVASYLEIEQTRFEDRLGVAWDVDPAALDARVPHLLLQPLVENAVRHGIAPRGAPGVVRISARRDDGLLRLEVRDDGVGFPVGPSDMPRRGVGLPNTRARLVQLYGERHTFEVRGADEGGTVTTVTIPFRRAHPS